MANPEDKTKIRWADATIRNVQANICSVAVLREEISLLFGTEHPRLRDGQAESIRLTDRVILSPFVAKQLAAALDRFMRDHEFSFGASKKASPRSTEAERKEKAAVLFRLVKELDVEIGLEHSFKILERTLLDNRFLLGVSKKEIEHNAQPRIIQICKKLDMPQPMMETFRQCLFDANYVHFGFEETENSCLYKVYVEFWESIREEIRVAGNPSRPFLLHLGFKWDAFDNGKKAVTKYTWHPWLSVAEIHARLSAILDPSSHGLALEIAGNVVNIAGERIPHQDILYLEVTEDDNPRRSFDINVYRAGFEVGEFYPLLARLGQHYAVPHADFHRLYGQIKTQRFGHLSGGLSREGTDFCTVYYGVEPVFGDRHREIPRAGDSMIAPTSAPRPRQTLSDPQVERTDEQAALLLEMVKGLQAPFGFERSFKIAEKTFLPHRFLAGFRSGAMGPEERERVLNLCRQIHMPEDFLSGFREELPNAIITLFGFEKSEKNRYYKAYLEFTERMKEAVEKDPAAPRPFLMFIGFKWDASDSSRKVVTRYTCFPAFVLTDMAKRASRLLCRKEGKNPYRIVEGILDLAAHRIGPNEFLYFEAEEENTERNSFSINVYRAGLKMAEIYPLLLEMVRHYDAPKELFRRTYEAAKTQILGHVAGGIDRDGRDFLTLYFSEKGSTGRGRMGQDPDEMKR